MGRAFQELNETWEVELPIEASLKGFLEGLMAVYLAAGFRARPSGATGPTERIRYVRVLGSWVRAVKGCGREPGAPAFVAVPGTSCFARGMTPEAGARSFCALGRYTHGPAGGHRLPSGQLRERGTWTVPHPLPPGAFGSSPGNPGLLAALEMVYEKRDPHENAAPIAAFWRWAKQWRGREPKAVA